MEQRKEDKRLLGHLAACPFLAGSLCAFLGCCLAGWLMGHSNIYRDFVRFHTHISPQSQYFPTACQVRALGRSRLDPDKVSVIIGGNSILFGHNPSELWTKHLQAILGDRFEVINFAIPAALPAEFGEVAAEMLERDHPKLLFVTIAGSSTCPTIPDGGFYRYFYWDAYYKGLIPHDARRAARLDREVKEREKEGQAFAELQRGMRLDASLRFQDCWTTVAHEHFCTVWTPATSGHFTRPRKKYTEGDCAEPPLGQRYPAGANERAMYIVRNLIRSGSVLLEEETPDGCLLVHLIRNSFPEPTRRRTLLLLPHDSPHYVGQLASAERAAYNRVFPAFVSVLEAEGVSALEVGANYTELDYLDCSHFSDRGGRCLATDVAPKLRAMAEQLGYLK